jgi:hypothetical protein
MSCTQLPKAATIITNPLSHLQSTARVSVVEIPRTSAQPWVIYIEVLKDISLLCTLLRSLRLFLPRKSYLSQGLLSSQKWKSAYRLFGRACRLQEHPVRFCMSACRRISLTRTHARTHIFFDRANESWKNTPLFLSFIYFLCLSFVFLHFHLPVLHP